MSQVIKKNKTYDFQKFKKIRPFRREIYNGVTLEYAIKEQINLKDAINKFEDFTKSKSWNKKEEKVLTFESVNKLLKRRQKVFNVFKSKMFPIRKATQGAGFKILTPKQMLQRLHKIAQVKEDNIFKK